MNKTMEKSYKISRVILAIIAFIIFEILFILIFEDITWQIPLVFAIIVFVLSFPSTQISKLIINIGNKLKSNLLKILFYVFLLPIQFFLFLIIYGFIVTVFEGISTPPNADMGTALSIAFFALFLVAVGTICVILPYIQTLIVLILKRFVKDNNPRIGPI